mmetsp:Transcript_9744/g.30070  ORF Transcript_9744/g.30070 Transcript_9744/m.30070 type:complete len:132 (-) Transcript_9744:3417-3812(-)
MQNATSAANSLPDRLRYQKLNVLKLKIEAKKRGLGAAMVNLMSKRELVDCLCAYDADAQATTEQPRGAVQIPSGSPEIAKATPVVATMDVENSQSNNSQSAASPRSEASHLVSAAPLEPRERYESMSVSVS